jgi:hypothetical protein
MNLNSISAMFIRFLLCIGLIGAVGAQQAVPEVQVRGTATVGGSQVILDITANTDGAALRSFGVRVDYNEGSLNVASSGSYAALWFLRDETGATRAYTDTDQPAPGTVTMIGGRFDGGHPDEGLAGERVLLGTVVFDRLDGNPPQLDFALAKDAPFVNFSDADGDSLDSDVIFHGVATRSPSADTDNDELPDDWEIGVFGDLTTSDGSGDEDGDGRSDADEFLAGTDPDDASSNTAFTVEVMSDGSKMARWNGALDRVYDILWSDDLDSFEEFVVGIPGTDAAQQRLDEAHDADPAGFYRLRTRYPIGGRD